MRVLSPDSGSFESYERRATRSFAFFKPNQKRVIPTCGDGGFESLFKVDPRYLVAPSGRRSFSISPRGVGMFSLTTPLT